MASSFFSQVQSSLPSLPRALISPSSSNKRSMKSSTPSPLSAIIEEQPPLQSSCIGSDTGGGQVLTLPIVEDDHLNGGGYQDDAIAVDATGTVLSSSGIARAIDHIAISTTQSHHLQSQPWVVTVLTPTNVDDALSDTSGDSYLANTHHHHGDKHQQAPAVLTPLVLTSAVISPTLACSSLPTVVGASFTAPSSSLDGATSTKLQNEINTTVAPRQGLFQEPSTWNSLLTRTACRSSSPASAPAAPSAASPSDLFVLSRFADDQAKNVHLHQAAAVARARTAAAQAVQSLPISSLTPGNDAPLLNHLEHLATKRALEEERKRCRELEESHKELENSQAVLCQVLEEQFHEETIQKFESPQRKPSTKSSIIVANPNHSCTPMIPDEATIDRTRGTTSLRQFCQSIRGGQGGGDGRPGHQDGGDGCHPNSSCHCTASIDGGGDGGGDFNDDHSFASIADNDDVYYPPWTHANIVVDNFITLKNTGTVPPWDSKRHHIGPVTCFPMGTEIRCMDRSIYLSTFTCGTTFDLKLQKRFQDGFPSIHPDAGLPGYFEWHLRLMVWSRACGAFIPPLHTLHPGCPYGTWFGILPTHVRINMLTQFFPILLAALCNLKAGFSTQEILGQTVHNSSLHPGLEPSTLDPSFHPGLDPSTPSPVTSSEVLLDLSSVPYCQPIDSPSSPHTGTLADKILYFQHLGFQSDVSVEHLHHAADGIPIWSDSSPRVCGHHSPSPECSTPDPIPVSPSAPSPRIPPDIPLRSLIHDKHFAQELFCPNKCSYLLYHMTCDQQRILWHQRLGHMHSRCVAEAHRSATGIPSLPIATELEKCPICLHAKLRQANRSKEDSCRTLAPNQGISIDFGFLVQPSKDTSQLHRWAGLNGETCYCLIVCHKTKMLYGECFASKKPPVDFINRWLLARHGLPVQAKDKYVRFDLCGELGKSPEIVHLFEHAGYLVEPTAPHSSHQNGPGERPHQTIADAIHNMLASADLAPKFWPYAFHHFLRLYNVTVHGTDTASPYKQMTGKKPDLSLLCVFGCRIYALPARPKRPDKALSDARTGIFLGFTKTMRNVLFYNVVSKLVKTTQHCAFDKAMHDLTNKPPNACLLTGLQTGDKLDYMGPTSYASSALEVVHTLFTAFESFTVPFDPNDAYPIGMEYDQCSHLDRAFLSNIRSPPIGHCSRTFLRKYKGSYIVSVNGFPVFTPDDIDKIRVDLGKLDSPPVNIPVVLAPERASELTDDRTSPLNLCLHDLRLFCAIQSIDGNGLNQWDYTQKLRAYADSLSNFNVTELIARLQTNDMTPEEKALKRFTHRNLKKLSNWPVWDEAFDAQLYQQFKDETLGLPIPCPGPTGDRPPNILCPQWSNMVKTNGHRKCRICIDGSCRSAPWLWDLASTYASCISQPCMRLFFAPAAGEGMIVTFGDTTNAYQQSPPPMEQCYLTIDDAYLSWYKKQYGIDLDPCTHVIPVLKALQGHPEAGALWERRINAILQKLGFQSTTHERSLYHGKLDGHTVLISRMVDDYAIACRDEAVSAKMIALINDQVTTENKGTTEGRYNGVDIVQSCDYIKLHCETYIDCMLQTHGWDHPAKDESDCHDIVPISPSSIESLQCLTPGPLEGTTTHRALQDCMKFSYRQLLGELIYAYVVARLDIGYAVTLLACFSSSPAEEHYHALHGVCKYLRRTKDWGLVYWRSNPVHALPAIPLAAPFVDASLPDFPKNLPMQLVGYVDAAHATDLATHCSISGLVFTLCGGAVAYKSKLQLTVSTSSTDAEFIAAVHAAKLAKHLRSVLDELGYAQLGPTPIYKDNPAAIAMINEDKPTTCSRHIDIQHFAIQEWRARGIVHMVYIPTTINPADASTKALSSVLHSCHVRRAMGHHGV